MRKEMMNKVVVNRCFGGFGLSQKAIKLMRDEYGYKVETAGPDSWRKTGEVYLNEDVIWRHDPRLVEVVEKLGRKANGDCALLEVVEIPGIRDMIEEYDGSETIYWPEDEDMWITIGEEDAYEEDYDEEDY